MKPPRLISPAGLICLLVAVCAVPAFAQQADDADTSPETPRSAASAADAAEGVNPSTTDDETQLVQPVSAEVLRRAVDSGQYVPFPRARLNELPLMKQQASDGQPPPVPAVAHAAYSAVLDGRSLTQGTLQYQLDRSHAAASVILGRTNLRQLEFSVDGRGMPAAALADGRLSLLTETSVRQLSATWSSEGTLTPDGIRFELQLPSAAVTEFRLTTQAGVTVTSPNATVSSAGNGDTREYTVYPRQSRLLTLVCNRSDRSGRAAGGTPVTINTALRVAQETVFAEWTIGMPPDLSTDSVVVVADDGCQITEVITEPGSLATWQPPDGTQGQLILNSVQGGELISVRGVRRDNQDGVIPLPFLSVSQQPQANQPAVVLPLKPTEIRLVMARELAVRRLTMDGLYQKEVSFNSIGEQVIELQQYRVDASAEIEVEPAAASIHQRLLIYRPPETPGLVTVYAELEPRSDQTFSLHWQLSGSWRPVGVDDMTTGLPVYSQLHPSADGSADRLQIDLRTAASASQPARLRIQFRSTQAITPQTTSLPVLVNDLHRSIGIWILSSSTSPFQTGLEAELIPNTREELQKQFPWAAESLPETGRLKLVRTDRLPTPEDAPAALQRSVPRATVEYQLRLSESLLVEELRLQLTADDQLPESVKLLFPEGVNVRLTEPATMEQLSPTGQLSEDHWQEWLLTLPPADRATHTVRLRVTRPAAVAKFAAIPRLPSASDVTLAVRNITDVDAGLARAELISESSAATDSQSVILEPGVRVSIPRVSSRQRLRFSQESPLEASLGVRGAVRMLVPQSAPDRVHCLADLVVSRTGSVSEMAIHWPDASDVQVFIDDRPVSCPPSESVTRILLPPDRASTGVRLLWTSPVEVAGWLRRMSAVKLPVFVLADRVELAHLIQMTAGDVRLTTPDGDAAVDADHSQRVAPPVVTDSPAIRSFLVNWQLASERGDANRLVTAADGRILFRMRSQRWMVACAVLIFCALVGGQRLTAGYRLRTLAVLLLIGSALTAWSDPMGAWCLFGWNCGLGALLLLRTCWPLLRDWWNQVDPSDVVKAESVASAAATALVAVLLTGQAPGVPRAPVLVNEAIRDSSPIVFVRRDLIPEQPESVATDVRASDVTAHVRLEQDSGMEIFVRTTVASPPDTDVAAFTVPTESATLAGCTLNDEPVAPVRGADGRPQIRLPTSASGMRSGRTDWQLHRISYTLRSDAAVSSGRVSVRIPLPFSARTRLTLESVSDPILTARLAGGQTGSRNADMVTFPAQYNRGPLDVELVTQESRAQMADRDWMMTVICRARVMEDRTILNCRYRLTSPLPLPNELLLPAVPGFQVGSVVSADGTVLKPSAGNGHLVVPGTREQLAEFEVTWEPASENMEATRTIPAVALMPPLRCRSARTLLAVNVAEPFEVTTVGQAGRSLTPSVLSDAELSALGLSSTDRCFDVTSLEDDIELTPELQKTQRTAGMTQSLIVGVQTIDWSCVCDMEVTGPLTFRQQIRVPEQLLVDDVSVSGNRVRSWSVEDGRLLVSFREGTRGSFQLSVRGVLQIPSDGLISVRPARLEDTDVIESSLLVSSTRDAAVQVEDASGTDRANPIADEVFPLNLHPVRLTIVDSERPVIFRTRTQVQTTARLLVLTYDNATSPHCDMALRILAGDQKWDGRIQLPDELADATVDWITKDSSIPLPVEGGELPARRLASGQAAILLLRGVRTAVNGSGGHLPLPRLDPEVQINRVQLFGRWSVDDTAEQAMEPWILQALRSDHPVATPRGVVDRGRLEHYDAQSHSIHITGSRSETGTSVSVVRRAVRSVAVTQVSSTGDSLSGTTDLLIDFGEATEALCTVPPSVRIISCRLEETELPQTAGSDTIRIPRSARIQRLRINWLLPRPHPGYLPRQSMITIPEIDAMEQVQFLMVETPPDQSSIPDSTLTAISPAQLETGLAAALSESLADSDTNSTDENSAAAQTIVQFRNDQQMLAQQPGGLFEMTDDAAAGLRWRLTFPWLQWVPLLALAVAWGTVTGRRMSVRRLSQVSSRSIAEDLSESSTPDESAVSDSTPSESDEIR